MSNKRVEIDAAYLSRSLEKEVLPRFGTIMLVDLERSVAKVRWDNGAIEMIALSLLVTINEPRKY